MRTVVVASSHTSELNSTKYAGGRVTFFDTVFCMDTQGNSLSSAVDCLANAEDVPIFDQVHAAVISAVYTDLVLFVHN